VRKIYNKIKCLKVPTYEELRRVKQEISEEAYKHLQGVRWALRKKKEESTDEEKGL